MVISFRTGIPWRRSVGMCPCHQLAKRLNTVKIQIWKTGYGKELNYNPGQNFRDTFTFLHQNSTIRSPPPPLNNVGCPGLKHVSKILFSLSTSTLFRGGGGNKFLIFFSDLTLSAILLFHKKLLQKCQLSLNQLARIVASVQHSVLNFLFLCKALFIWSRVPETTLPLETTLRNVYMEL